MVIWLITQTHTEGHDSILCKEFLLLEYYSLYVYYAKFTNYATNNCKYFNLFWHKKPIILNTYLNGEINAFRYTA
jgi:hypothetical protein